MNILSLTNMLSATLTSAAQGQAQLALTAIENSMTNRLNQQIAQVQAQNSDTSATGVLQSQLPNLTNQQTTYTTANNQITQNGYVLADLSTQLASLATAAKANDASAFDNALAQANYDASVLTVINPIYGLQSDGSYNLRMNGLGIQSSATYLAGGGSLSSALTDINNAQTTVQNVQTVTGENASVAQSVLSALSTQINSINSQISTIQTNQSNAISTQTTKLQQQEQTKLHVLELKLGTAAQSSSSIISSNQSAMVNNLENQQGSRYTTSQNGFFGALQTATNIRTQLTNTALQGASNQPSATTSQANSITQSAAGSLLNIFS